MHSLNLNLADVFSEGGVEMEWG